MAMIRALKERRNAEAALVAYGQPAEHFTPHRGGHSIEVYTALLPAAIENIDVSPEFLTAGLLCIGKILSFWNSGKAEY